MGLRLFAPAMAAVVATVAFAVPASAADQPQFVVPIPNGGFEAGLDKWTATGTVSVVTAPVHSGLRAARLGGRAPSATSTLSQTFSAPGAAFALVVWYRMTCGDSTAVDAFTATLRDNVTGVTTVPRSPTCETNPAFRNFAAALRPGRSYTLTLVLHDRGLRGAASVVVDDVSVFVSPPPA